jgi:hypothetical protein
MKAKLYDNEQLVSFLIRKDRLSLIKSEEENDCSITF